MTYDQINAPLVAGRYRAPDWRDAEAQRLVQEGLLPSPRLHDKETTRLAHFYRQRQRCLTEFDLAAIYTSARHVSEAVELHELPCHGPRCVLEALVLADEQPGRIASRMGTTTQVVEVFEKAFFDIRSRLSRHDFVINHCIGLQNVAANRQDFACTAMKFFSYVAGVECIDLFTFGAGTPHRWQTVCELVSGISRRARVLLGVDAVQDGRFADPRARQDLLRMVESLEQWSGTFGDEAAPKTKYERDAARLLEVMGGRVPRSPFVR